MKGKRPDPNDCQNNFSASLSSRAFVLGFSYLLSSIFVIGFIVYIIRHLEYVIQNVHDKVYFQSNILLSLHKNKTSFSLSPC